ncbi:hypothetical protein HDV00_005109 [Rhizophlyctis rosea]|nr:hypothetical protein HDV00_005109 [Rhizophlyctis rosea]
MHGTKLYGTPTTTRPSHPSPGTQSPSWNNLWNAINSHTVPQLYRTPGPPVQSGNRIYFRYEAPPGTRAVYLAGAFNRWAQNNEGKVINTRFRMTTLDSRVWVGSVELGVGTHPYQFVVEDAEGRQSWIRDPSELGNDQENHSLVTVTDVWSSPYTSAAPSATHTGSTTTSALTIEVGKVWVRPGESNTLQIVGDTPTAAHGRLTVTDPFGKTVSSSTFQPGSTIHVPSLPAEGGCIALIELLSAQNLTIAQGSTILTVTNSISSDLRYGFYATYTTNSNPTSYTQKSTLFSRFHINAIEYYDYFPAHGHYAPTQPTYTYEPFNISINGLDVRDKINSARDKNILAIAYVSAYAASESVYRAHPYPMTDAEGRVKIFNGAIMTEEEAEREGKEKWFWIMDVAGDSEWYEYIMGEFGRTLGAASSSFKPLMVFDGFELDTYGDKSDTVFYAKSSKRNGDLLTDVLHDFVAGVRDVTRKQNPGKGLVAFNSVNEFGIDAVHDVVDVLFLEIWRDYTDRVVDLVDICYRHRATSKTPKRVVLKLYPADLPASPVPTTWPTATLARVLGAAMTGGGTLMAVGEPDENTGTMHALNSLYYPDHQPLSEANADLLQRYYAHDALMYGLTHGQGVVNVDLDVVVNVPGCVARTFAAADRRAVVVNVLWVGGEWTWTSDLEVDPKNGVDIVIHVGDGVSPVEVWYHSPDSEVYAKGVKVEFKVGEGKVKAMIPQRWNHGTVTLRF